MLRFAIIGFAMLTATSAFAAAVPQSPVDTIKALYAADAPFYKNTGEGVMGDEKARARFFSKALLAALRKDEADADKRGEPPTIEGDPFTDSQEPGTKDFKYTQVSTTANKAVVRANFDRGDGSGREDVTYSLILEGGQWRVDDIAYKRLSDPVGPEENMRKTLGMK
jgi:hypothetical protein